LTITAVKALIQAGETIDFSKGEIAMECATSGSLCNLVFPGQDPQEIAAIAKAVFDKSAGDYNKSNLQRRV
jgi:hypothetical protein